MAKKFRSVSDKYDPADFALPEYSQTEPVFGPKTDEKTGAMFLVKTGETNVQDKINAAAEDSMFETVMRKLNAGEKVDIGELEVSEENYGDFTNSPKSMAEALELARSVKKANVEATEKLEALEKRMAAMKEIQSKKDGSGEPKKDQKVSDFPAQVAKEPLKSSSVGSQSSEGDINNG